MEVFVASKWTFVEEDGELKRCLTIGGIEDDALNASLPNALDAFDIEARLHWIEGQDGLNTTYDERPDRLCIRGLDPVVLQASTLDVVLVDGVRFHAGSPDLPMTAVLPQEGWRITVNRLHQ